MNKDARQYTIRKIPVELDRRLRKLARQRGASLNSVIVECLARQVDLDAKKAVYDDLDDLIGKWKPDTKMEAALADQRKIDKDAWK
jgi:hypothetical protein